MSPQQPSRAPGSSTRPTVRRLFSTPRGAALGAGSTIAVAIIVATIGAGPSATQPRGSEASPTFSSALTALVSGPVPTVAPSGGPPAQGSPSEGTTAPPASARPSAHPTSAPPGLPIGGDALDEGLFVNLAPSDHGSLYVSLPSGGADNRTILIRLDAAGRTAKGWPIRLGRDESCSPPLPASDGSVRLVCIDETTGIERAFAFGVDGHSRPGWPVAFDEGLNVEAPRVVGDRLFVVLEEPGPGVDSLASVVVVSADGSIDSGGRVASQSIAWTVGPDGSAYGSAYDEDARTTTIVAVDHSGLREGWPISIDAVASTPAFGPNGRVYVVVGDEGGTPTRTLVFERDGRPNEASGSDELGAIATFAHSGDRRPAPPIVTDDGSAIVVGYDAVGGSSSIWHLDPRGDLIGAEPYRPMAGIEVPGRCDPSDTSGCGLGIAMPLLDRDGTVHVLEPALNTAVGGRVVTLGPDGSVRPGWPVGLRRPGSSFWRIVGLGGGSVWVLAVEREGDGRSSASILSIAADSTIRYVVTVLEP